MMTAKIAKDYINEQYSIIKSLNDNFSAVKDGYYFIGRDAACMVWDTMYVLADIKMVMDDEADTKEQMMELLEDLREEYKRGVTPGAACNEKNVLAAINYVIYAVNELYTEC